MRPNILIANAAQRGKANPAALLEREQRRLAAKAVRKQPRKPPTRRARARFFARLYLAAGGPAVRAEWERWGRAGDVPVSGQPLQARRMARRAEVRAERAASAERGRA